MPEETNTRAALERYARGFNSSEILKALSGTLSFSGPTCMAALDAMLAHIDKNRDVWLGWTYWAAGAWPARYFTSVQPVNGVDTPQMQVLLKHVPGARQNRAANP